MVHQLTDSQFESLTLDLTDYIAKLEALRDLTELEEVNKSLKVNITKAKKINADSDNIMLDISKLLNELENIKANFSGEEILNELEEREKRLIKNLQQDNIEIYDKVKYLIDDNKANMEIYLKRTHSLLQSNSDIFSDQLETYQAMKKYSAMTYGMLGAFGGAFILTLAILFFGK